MISFYICVSSISNILCYICTLKNNYGLRKIQKGQNIFQQIIFKGSFSTLTPCDPVSFFIFHIFITGTTDYRDEVTELLANTSLGVN